MIRLVAPPSRGYRRRQDRYMRETAREKRHVAVR
jgi:hypothetical protein